MIYERDTTKIVRISFFVEGPEYDLLGLVPTKLHLFGAADKRQKINLLGTDFARPRISSRGCSMVTRVTLSAGLIGVAFSFVIGLFIVPSPDICGITDALIQRSYGVHHRSCAYNSMWYGVGGSTAHRLDPLFVYVLITFILALIGWTHLARVVRAASLPFAMRTIFWRRGWPVLRISHHYPPHAARHDSYIIAGRHAGHSGNDPG